MKETFTYKEKMSFSYFYPVIAFVLLAGICWYFHYGLAFGKFRLLAYPNSVYVLAAIAVVFLVSALLKMNKANESKKNPNPIKVEETGFSFPHKGNKTEIAFTTIEKLDKDNDEDDGPSFIVTSGGKNYEFFEEKFETPAQYAAFVDLIEKGAKK